MKKLRNLPLLLKNKLIRNQKQTIAFPTPEQWFPRSWKMMRNYPTRNQKLKLTLLPKLQSRQLFTHRETRLQLLQLLVHPHRRRTWLLAPKSRVPLKSNIDPRVLLHGVAQPPPDVGGPGRFMGQPEYPLLRMTMWVTLTDTSQILTSFRHLAVMSKGKFFSIYSVFFIRNDSHLPSRCSPSRFVMQLFQKAIIAELIRIINLKTYFCVEPSLVKFLELLITLSSITNNQIILAVSSCQITNPNLFMFYQYSYQRRMFVLLCCTKD